MSNDPRAALQALVSALEEHLAAASNRRGDDDPAVDGAYLAIADAFDAYEEALYEAYDEVTPLTVFAEEDDDLDDSDEDEEDAEGEDPDEELLEDNEMLDEDLVDEEDYDDLEEDADSTPEGGRARRTR